MRKSIAVTLLALSFGGCPSPAVQVDNGQPSGNTSAGGDGGSTSDAAAAPKPILTAAEMNGSWRFLANNGAVCFTFDGGRVIYYSALCDGVNDAVAPASFTLSDDNKFHISFPAILSGLSHQQSTVTLDGTVTDANTVIGTVSTSDGGAGTLSYSGRLVRP